MPAAGAGNAQLAAHPTAVSARQRYGAWIGDGLFARHIRRTGCGIGLVHVHAVQHSRVFQRRRPVAERVCACIPAGIDHDRRVSVFFAYGRYQLPVQQGQIARTALHLRIPLLHLPEFGMFSQAALFLRCGLIDQVVGRDGRMTFQFARHISPERRSLGPVTFVLPQAIIELALVVLRPAHTR